MAADYNSPEKVLERAAPFLDSLKKYATQYNLDLPQMISQIDQESRFNNKAKSPVGAFSMTQFMPKTAKQYGLPDNPTPDQAIEANAKYMNDLLNRYGGDYDKATAAYNAGPTRVDRYGADVPIKETQDYRANISQKSASLRPLLADAGAVQYGGGETANAGISNVAPTMNEEFQLPKRKNKAADTFAMISSLLGMAGGTAANVIGGIKGNPGAGNATISGSTNLLEMLSKEGAARGQQQSVIDFLNKDTTSDPATKRAIYAAAEAGKIDEAVALMNAGPKAAITGRQELKNKQTLATDPTLLGAQEREYKMKQDYEQTLKKEFADYQSKIKSNDPKKIADAQLDLMKSFGNQQIVKSTRTVNNEANRALSSWASYQKNPTSIQSKNALDQTLINVFNKVLGPDSVVRESEYARTPEGVSLINRISGLAEKIQKGGSGLKDGDRQDLVNQIQLLKDVQAREIAPYIKTYAEIAKDQGVDPTRVLIGFDPNYVPPSQDQPTTPKNAKSNNDELLKKFNGKRID